MMSQRTKPRRPSAKASRAATPSASKTQHQPRQLVIAPSEATVSDPVLRAAYDSIIEVGVRRTTLADVARRAGVSRMTVYRKYDDLPRLLSGLLTVELGALLDEAMARNVDLHTERERLAHTASDTCAALAAHPVMQRVLSVDPEAILPLIVDRLGSTQIRALTILEQMVSAGQDPTGDGSIRPGDPHLMALSVLTTCQSFIFSHRAIASADPLGGVYPELTIMINGYLRPVN